MQPEIKGILELGIYATDLRAMERFYGEVLGLKKMSADYPRHVFFHIDDRSVLLIFNPEETIKETEIPPHGATGSQHFAFSVPSDQMDAWRARLNEHGVEIEREIAWPNGARSVYFRDPAGHCVEIVTEQLWQE